MAEQWNEFSRAVMPPDASPIQKREMRRAFYAGAHAILIRVMDFLSPGDDPTEADLQIMADVELELRSFADSVKAGRA